MVEAILAHSVDHEVLQAVFKISWFEVSHPATNSCPTKYFQPGTSHIQDPQSLFGHVLVVPDFVDKHLFFVHPHFSRYYSRYAKNKYFIKYFIFNTAKHHLLMVNIYHFLLHFHLRVAQWKTWYQ